MRRMEKTGVCIVQRQLMKRGGWSVKRRKLIKKKKKKKKKKSDSGTDSVV